MEIHCYSIYAVLLPEMMRCGPAPLAAIREGNVYLGYDTKFIFAEVPIILFNLSLFVFVFAFI